MSDLQRESTKSSRAGYVPRLSDIYLVTYPRSGTTWLQMILYQLSSDGSMNFGHISKVIPFLERSLRSGCLFEDMPSPRIFKSHLHFRHLSRWQGRYIYLVRSGKDVMVSYFYFYENYLGYSGTFSDFFRRFMAGEVLYGSWFRHVASWGEHARDANVLFLHYEDLVNSFEASVLRIASFCGWAIPTERYALLMERCSFPFMQRHEDKFAPEVDLVTKDACLTPRGAFIRRGKVNGWKEHFTVEQEEMFEQAARSFGVGG
jgi:Sulfotransferase domain